MHKASDRLMHSVLLGCNSLINVLFMEGVGVYSSCSVIDICLIMTLLPTQHINNGAHIYLLQWCCNLHAGSPDTEM